MDIYFVAGLPRSGSTLLLNVLGQNPKFHVTPTNGLIEMFSHIHNSWHKFIEFRSQGLQNVQFRVKDAVRGMMYGFFEKEFKEGKIVFDKNRGWLQYIEELEYVLEKKIKIIACIRDPREIASSFEKVYRNRKNDYRHHGEGGNQAEIFVSGQTVEGRCAQWFAPGGVAGIACNRFRDASRRAGDRLVVFPYSYFVNKPAEAMNELHRGLSLPPYQYNFEEIKQITHEDDCWHGMDLHVVGGSVQSKPSDFREYIPEDIIKQVEQVYPDIIALSEGWRQIPQNVKIEQKEATNA
jgi:sulfotransferase